MAAEDREASHAMGPSRKEKSEQMQ